MYIRYCAAAVLALGCFFAARRFLADCAAERYKNAFFSKLAAGLCFVACGFVARGVCTDGRFAALVTTGLVLGLVGDELLALRFIFTERFVAFFSAGAAAFALGHVFYIAALITRFGFSWWTLLFLAAFLAADKIYAVKRQTDPGELRLKAAAYIVLVSLMAAVACGSAAGHFGAGTAAFALGGLLFTASDDILCAYSFGSAGGRRANTLIHLTYYLAQFCIACSMFFI